MDNILKAVKLTEVIRAGSSLPVIASDESGTEYIVKLTGIGDGVITNITEYIATCIGHHIGLPVLRPYLMNIDEDTQIEIKNDEFADVINRSFGLNVCHTYFRNAFPYEKTGKTIEKEITDKIFLFDFFFLNVDRRKAHSDVIAVESDIYATDFGSSFLVRGIVNNINFYQDESILKQIKRSPFYNEDISRQIVSDMLSRLKNLDISSIISELPDEWLKETNENAAVLKAQMEERLRNYIDNEQIIFDTLDTIHELKIETEEEIKKRQQENRKKFERDILFKNRKQ